jgi:hypothetical protein
MPPAYGGQHLFAEREGLISLIHSGGASKKMLSLRCRDIVELESYFCDIVLPTHSIEIASYSKIKNIALFIDSHLSPIKSSIKINNCYIDNDNLYPL